MIEQNSNISVKKYKITIVILSVIILVLSILLAITKTRVNTFIIEKEKAITETQVMQHQLDSLLTEHEKIKNEYGVLTEELALKDSIIQANAAEIQKLIASNAGKQRIQKKLDYLRGITQDYVAQIDKLLVENQELKNEIAGIKDEYNKEQEKTATLIKEKDDLNSQLNNAAALTAYNVTAYAIQLKSGNKEEITDRAKKADKIKISFTIGKNPLIPVGMKAIYVRIARPDNAILHDGQSFDYNGQNIMYSLKESIYYQQKPVSLSLYYEKTDRIVPGTYNIAVFADNTEIGQTQLTLK